MKRGAGTGRPVLTWDGRRGEEAPGIRKPLLFSSDCPGYQTYYFPLSRYRLAPVSVALTGRLQAIYRTLGSGSIRSPSLPDGGSFPTDR
ncbi:hypothetical protein ACFLU3_00970 [Chloroflexota bacterium]